MKIESEVPNNSIEQVIELEYDILDPVSIIRHHCRTPDDEAQGAANNIPNALAKALTLMEGDAKKRKT